ncbi:MAG: hypothetical protein K0B11_12210 [Mariniphaga sp.]|nr:hypothetical protein [Mariniphaga sp.]
MKKTGTGRFRQLKVLDKPLQDGIKDFLLCDTCEKKLGKKEKWFKENFFEPFLNYSNTKFECNNELRVFAISILWRVLIYFKEDSNQYRFKNELDLAELEWRNFLNIGSTLNYFQSIHIAFIPEKLNIEGGGEYLYSYFHRAVDIEIVESNMKSFIYAKFSRFIFFGLIKGISDNTFKGTNIITSDILNPLDQEMDDADLVDFIINRSKNVKSYKDLSVNQQKQNDKYYEKRLDDIRGNDYWKTLMKDINK